MGRFASRDPKLQFWTPYSYVGNQPLTKVDPTGLEIGYAGNEDQIAESKSFVSQIQSTPRGAELVEGLQCSDKLYTIQQVIFDIQTGQKPTFNTGDLTISYDPYTKIYAPTEGGLMPISPVIQLAHEMGHAYDFNRGSLDIDSYVSDPSAKLKIEIGNINENENPIRRSLGFSSRLESERGYQLFLPFYSVPSR